MKPYLFLFWAFFGLGGVLANSYSQNTTLTLTVHDAVLKEVFDEIERQSEYIFFYNDDDVDVDRPVDVSVNKATIHEVMDKVLDKTKSDYKVVNRQVILFTKPETEKTETATRVEQSKLTVTGQVKSNTGELLVGVSVIEKGTSTGTITDLDGNFSLVVSDANVVLQVSYIGFETQEIPVNGKKLFNITLKEDVAALDEVIVVAYGTQKKSSVTGSIAVVNAENLKTVTSPDVSTMLQGKVAGVQVLNTSGKPGEKAQIRIRGKGTINSSVDPLWVIDGVVAGTGAQLNPNEIETISVLKDAGATALYGSRATNGVILVTTKSGRMGESKVDVSAKFSVSKQNLGNFKLMNSKELYDYTSSMENLQSVGIDKWLDEKLLEHDTDWFKFATQSAFTQNYTVSYTAGSEKVRSFISGDFYNEEGTVKGYKYNRYSVRSNTDYYVNKRLTLKAKFSGSYWDDTFRQHDLYSAMTYLPWDYPYNEDGSIRTGQESDWHGRDNSNYLYNLQWNYAKGKQLGLTANMGFDYKITDYLVFESNNNIGYRYHRTDSYTDPRAIGASSYNGAIGAKNELTTTRYTNQMFRFNHTFTDVHNVSAFIGYEFSDYMYEINGATGRGIPIGSEVLGVAANPYAVEGDKSEWAMQAFYFNGNYTYDDRYMAQFSYRLDGSSRFGKDNRYGGFFTIGWAWSLHNEAFMKRHQYINSLKIRGSFGSIGNTPGGGDYGYLSVYNLSAHYNGIPSAVAKRLGNPELTWEKCYETNIGVDARLFDRLGITLDYYYKNTSDLLYAVDLSSLTGFEFQYQNIGAVKNEGFEVTLSPDIIRTKDFNWSMDFNLGYNKNKIKELYEGKHQIIGNHILDEGSAIGTWYLYEWAGVDMYSGDPLWYTTAEDGTKTLTRNINEATKQKMGSMNPKLTGGIMTNLSYKNFSLSAAFSFVSGNKIYHYARQFYDNDGAYPTYNSMKLKSGWSRWEKPGDIATHPRPVAGGNGNSNKTSSRYLERGDFFRMNNLTFSYALPTSLLQKAGVRSANVSLSGENLFTITEFSGTDAELAAGNRNGTADADLYPSSRRFSLGLNITF